MIPTIYHLAFLLCMFFSWNLSSVPGPQPVYRQGVSIILTDRSNQLKIFTYCEFVWITMFSVIHLVLLILSFSFISFFGGKSKSTNPLGKIVWNSQNIFVSWLWHRTNWANRINTNMVPQTVNGDWMEFWFCCYNFVLDALASSHLYAYENIMFIV